MPRFTIETTYQLPTFRHRTYEAETLAEACRIAIGDDDWSEQEEDDDPARDTYVTGAWPGDARPYSAPMLPITSHFGETLQRKPTTSRSCPASSRSLRTRRRAALPMPRSGAAVRTPRSRRPRRSSPARAIRRSMETRHDRIHLKIAFWLRAYDGFIVEADTDREAMAKAKLAAKTAMESTPHPEHIDIEERRDGIIAFIDRIASDGRRVVIEDIDFDDDRIHEISAD